MSITTQCSSFEIFVLYCILLIFRSLFDGRLYTYIALNLSLISSNKLHYYFLINSTQYKLNCITYLIWKFLASLQCSASFDHIQKYPPICEMLDFTGNNCLNTMLQWIPIFCPEGKKSDGGGRGVREYCAANTEKSNNHNQPNILLQWLIGMIHWNIHF